MTRAELEDWFMYWAEFHEPGYTKPSRTAEDVFQSNIWYFTPWPNLDDMDANRKSAVDVRL